MSNKDWQEMSDETLDPKDWMEMRGLAHQMVDDMMDYLENARNMPVWQKIPTDVKASYDDPIPMEGENIQSIYDSFLKNILPYNKGNFHPRFFAWVQGACSPIGVLAEMLAAAMNPNVTIGEHSAMYIDRQVIQWCKQMMNFPADASGILLSGGSMANVTALVVARDHQLNMPVRKHGLKSVEKQMVLYCSTETHTCIQKAAEVCGLGTDAIRKIGVNDSYQINLDELEKAIQNDIELGFAPFCIVGNAGTVNTGAIDPLDDLVAIAKKYNLWLHIDGAFGALAKLVPSHATVLKGIEQADSLAFDLHKWMYMPYEVGCALFKNGTAHRNSFSVTPNYLLQEKRGLTGGPDPINNFGMELSRGFKALKVWMSLKEHGLKKYAAMIEKNIQQAAFLADLISKEKCLELLAPVSMNIVCFRYLKDGYAEEKLDILNKEILMQLQEQGIASPSSTILGGKFAIRVCNVNQRTKKEDLHILVNETLRIGDAL